MWIWLCKARTDPCWPLLKALIMSYPTVSTAQGN